jgi:hypothetical protein
MTGANYRAPVAYGKGGNLEATVIDPLPFSLDVPNLFEKLRVRAHHREEIAKLAAEAVAVARPKALYKLAFIEDKGAESVTADGITFTSRVLRVNLDALHRFFAFVGTAGHELEAWADSKQDMLAHFYADAINEAVLHAAMITFAAQLTERFQLASTAVMNPGSLTDWPLREQRPLFALLGDVRSTIGVELTDSLLMVPRKSVSGILFVAEETFASCQLCPRLDCPNRRAPYDAGLFERKYT